jgi:DNA-directed RNA polymerase specialized sigma24 family protein
MGQPTTRKNSTKAAGTRRERFARYFPRLFAYVQAMTGDESTARDATACAFEATLGEDHLDENEFALSLFTAGRELCVARARARASLTEIEHEVLSLTFDAQLPRAQVAELLDLEGDAVVGILLSGLHKLNDAAAAQAPVSHRMHGLTA